MRDIIPFEGVLRQADQAVMPVEARVVQQVCLTHDISQSRVLYVDILQHADALRRGRLLPIGSVPFMQEAMRLAGIVEPANMSYPRCLQHHLLRRLALTSKAHVVGAMFVKPVQTKLFTGFVLADPLADPEHVAAYQAVPEVTPVWVSTPVIWQSEWRVYVAHHKILGMGRYDDKEEGAPIPSRTEITAMIQELAAVAGSPAAYSLDVGVLSTGETALVECNDAWALGYYRGTMTPADYLYLLAVRWQQLLQQRMGSHLVL